MGNTWSLQHVRTVPCVFSLGMCVSLKHRLVIVARYDGTLWMYSLDDGSVVCSIGSKGSGKGQFHLFRGGMCTSPDGDSVLVADTLNDRVQQVRIADGSWMRFIGEGVLSAPEYVDANATVLVTVETFSHHRISVFAWADGSVLTQFGGWGRGSGQLIHPNNVRLLADGGGLVVADTDNSRLCVFSVRGEFVKAIGNGTQDLLGLVDVMECPDDDGFVVTSHTLHHLVKLSAEGKVLGTFGQRGVHDGAFVHPSASAALPNGGLVVREYSNYRVQVFRGMQLRGEWIRVCVAFARFGGV
jgi:hypothetical protein